MGLDRDGRILTVTYALKSMPEPGLLGRDRTPSQRRERYGGRRIRTAVG